MVKEAEHAGGRENKSEREQLESNGRSGEREREWYTKSLSMASPAFELDLDAIGLATEGDPFSDDRILEATGASSMEKIVVLRLKIDTTESSLGDLGHRLPNVTELKVRHLLGDNFSLSKAIPRVSALFFFFLFSFTVSFPFCLRGYLFYPFPFNLCHSSFFFSLRGRYCSF